MSKKIAFLFPGQGSQYPGMGKDFFDNFSKARNTFEEANDLLHMDLSSLIFDSDENILKKTVNSQLSIFVTSVAILRVLEDEFSYLSPNVCAGLSLGEYSALCAAKKKIFSESLLLVQKRAKYMNDACKKNKGTMAAVLGLDSDLIEETLKSLNPPHLVWAANYNTVDQTVISGTEEGVRVASAALIEKKAKKIIRLPVQGAFHSGLMKEAQDRLKPEIEKTKFLDSDIDIIMNVPGDYVKDLEEIKKYLILQVTNSIRWKQSIDVMNRDSVELYIEIGPGKSLTMMNKKNKVNGLSINVDKICDLEKLSHEVK